MQQVLVRLGGPDGVPIYGFGMMLLLAFAACLWLGGRRARQAGLNDDIIPDLALWIFLGGLLGARVIYLLFDKRPSGVWEFLLELPRIWDGGIVFYGSVLGGLAGYGLGWWLSFRKWHIPTLKLADVLAPTVAVGLCLGRLGCF